MSVPSSPSDSKLLGDKIVPLEEFPAVEWAEDDGIGEDGAPIPPASTRSD